MIDATRYLIINADDFGQSAGVNAGIIKTHERGVVTSASLMVRWPAAGEAAQYARGHSSLSLGIHLDFGECAFRDGEWIKLYQVVAEDDPGAVGKEIERQFDAFRTLVGRDPTHIDAHQHAHRKDPARSIVLGIAGRLNVPVRNFTPGIRYCGDFYGQDDTGVSYPDLVSVEGLTAILRDLPPGITEIGCHPAEGDDLNTMYRTERNLEVLTLCDPGIRQALEQSQIRLRSFESIPRN